MLDLHCQAEAGLGGGQQQQHQLPQFGGPSVLAGLFSVSAGGQPTLLPWQVRPRPPPVPGLRAGLPPQERCTPLAACACQPGCVPGMDCASCDVLPCSCCWQLMAGSCCQTTRLPGTHIWCVRAGAAAAQPASLAGANAAGTRHRPCHHGAAAADVPHPAQPDTSGKHAATCSAWRPLALPACARPLCMAQRLQRCCCALAIVQHSWQAGHCLCRMLW